MLGLFAAAASIFAVIVILLATRVPDAYTQRVDLGDPPSSWGEAALAVTWAGGMTLLVSTAFVIAIALAMLAFGSRLARIRPFLIAIAVPPVLVVAMLGLLLAANAGEARLAVNCDDFRFDRSAFESSDKERWERQGFGLEDCESVIYGASKARVQQLLGAPEREAIDGQLWIYRDRLQVRFSGDGVERVRLRVDD